MALIRIVGALIAPSTIGANNIASDVSLGGGGGGGLTVVSVSTNTTANSNHAYLVSANSAKTITLPASPTIGDRVYIMDVTGSANAYNITIDGNGANVTVWPYLIMDKSRTSVEFMYVSSGQWNISSIYQTLSPPVVGEQSYTTPGTYSFVVPVGVASVSAVLVGAGASSASGGGGGGLRYINNLPVSAGETITVVVGQSYLTSLAEDSVLKRGANTLVYAGGGGIGGSYNRVGGIGSTLGAGTYGGTIGGGDGGHSDSALTREAPALIGDFGGAGGGGAGGYSGNGGHGAGQGKDATAGSGGGGGGGGRGGGNPGGAGGGGVGLFGQGSSGSAGTNGYTAGGGGGGSSGASGGNSSYNSGTSTGGLYGGGGGGNDPAYNAQYTVAYMGAGANGAVRIIWGAGRAFPSTNVGSM